MVIDKIQILGPEGQGKTEKSARGTGDKTIFSQALREAMGKSTEKAMSDPTQREIGEAVCGKVEFLLDVLEDYSRHLASESFKPDDIEPHMYHLKAISDQLEAVIAQQSTPHALREILEEAVLLSRKEYARYLSGFYG